MGSCPGHALLTLHGKATKSCRNEFRERVGTTVERILAGEARTETCKARVAERKRDRGDVRVEPGNKDDKQMAVRHSDASGGDIRENQHEEDRMRDIQVNERRSEATDEEQTDEWRKTARFEQEASSAAASSDPTVALEYPARDETPSRSGSVLVQKLCHVDDDEHISALDVLHRRSVGVVSRRRCRRSQEN